MHASAVCKSQAHRKLLWGPGQITKMGPLITSLEIVIVIAIKLQAEEPEKLDNPHPFPFHKIFFEKVQLYSTDLLRM